MTEVAMVWLGALTLLNVVVVAAVLILGRQVGLIYSRIPPQGARMGNPGPEIGDRLAARELPTQTGTLVRMGEGTRRTLAVFMSASCTVCTNLAPALHSISHSDRDRLQVVVLVTRSSPEETDEFIKTAHLEGLPVAFAPGLAMEWKVVSTPYALLIAADGVVRAKGIVNNLDHLESLLNADASGTPSMEARLSTIHAREHLPLLGGPAGNE